MSVSCVYPLLQHNIAVKKYYHNDTYTYGAVRRKTAHRDRVKKRLSRRRRWDNISLSCTYKQYYNNNMF